MHPDGGGSRGSAAACRTARADTAAAGAVVINEFMASNGATVTDESGEYEDWIELYNTTSAAISLAGCYLTDNAGNPTKWNFPDVSIAAGGYLIVWADEDDGDLHAAFKLSASGESIVLLNADQTVIDTATFGAQTTDVSMARYPNGTGDLVAMAPTFNGPNLVAGMAKGDVDGDTDVDLEDVILALQVVGGVTPSVTVHVEADVNGDQAVGLPEAVYALRSVAASADTTNRILLNGDSITVTGSGTTVSGTVVTVTASGTYEVSGSLTDGQLVVDSSDGGTVTLVLNGAAIHHSTGAPLYVASAGQAVITLADNTTNELADSQTYVFPDAETDEPNAALFSKDDLVIQGNGSLIVNGNYNDAIASKDTLLISGGVITVNAVDDGIRGKDSLTVTGGTLTVTSGGDGLKSDNDEDTTKGVITVGAGTLTITSGGDAVEAETNLSITGGTFTITTAGGNTVPLADDASAKGLKATAGIVISGGTFTIDSADDAVHSNGTISIADGTLAITSGDDGIHADTSITIAGGDIRISKSYEGIESAVITIDNGTIHVVSSDDGVNVAGGVDGSSIGGRPGQNDFTTTTSQYLYLNGGYLVVTAAGDGIDVNGAIRMTGGTVLVNGPTANDNGALDYDVSFVMTGGFLVAAGSSGMTQAPGTTSTQKSVMVTFGATRSAGTLFHVRTSAGTGLVTFAPAKQYQSVVFSSPSLATGTAYEVYTGGSSTGTVTDGLYQGGTYTAGTKAASFTVSSVVTKVSAP